jgi:long-chain fatty acid transport protein
MSIRGLAGLLRAGSALGFLIIASAQANAGGIALREQSVYGQGTSFAGVAAGGALSSMFWNPATMTQFPGKGIEVGSSALFPFSKNNPTAGTLLGLGGTSDTASDALVPNAYFTYQFSPNLWLGVAVNSPFGLTTGFPDLWAGRNYGASSSLKTYNTTPSVAWRINDWLSVGAGAQIQFAKTHLKFGFQPTFGSNIFLDGDGWSFGATAGLTITPGPYTSIGLGWRSRLNQDIDGTVRVIPTPPGTSSAFSTTANLPDTVSLGIRHRMNERWTLMGTAEWSNWSRIGTLNLSSPSGGPATIAGLPITLPIQWKDGWFFSGGAEYQWTERLAVRAGVGYEISPVTDQVRIPLLADDDRIWASVGATWQVWKGFSFDLAYTHIWIKDAPINISATSGNPWFRPAVPIAYTGNADGHVDILSLALVFRWGAPEPAPRPIITK